ncbi:putative F-box protein At1g47790 [Nicotiana tomentosiformis]|uniref:putative F-box protein At1g47790 n=1 Tax=Nicotiana tomentosiformis TaxID=4098 RepID=UPI00051C502F|nr:putative F-box protein At1g32420 [Nicotiana tomentosiformis]
MDEEENGSGVQFADDIVFEIPIWLPTKSLMRFKCVAKAWNTLIRHDPNFVKSHIAHSLARPSATHLLFQLDISPPLPSGQPSSNSPRAQLKERSPLQLAPHHYSDTRVVYDICSNQCNGLVCLYDLYRHKSQIYLYNITTGEIKALPSSLVKVFEYSKVPTLFMGFDPIKEKYKLLYFSDEFKIKIKILALGTNSWREVKLIPFQPSPKFSNLEKAASLVEVEWSNIPKIVFATTSFISAPTTLVFPNHFSLKFASNFVENIIPLSFVDV